MKLFISLNGKQRGALYHYTNKVAALSILRTGKLQLATGRGTLVEKEHGGGKNFFASLTRSRFGAYHFKGNTDSAEVYGMGQVMITFDGDGLSDRYLIKPVDYWGYRGSLPSAGLEHGKEIEERLLSDKAEIDVLKYIKRVDFIQAALFMKKETYGMDMGKFKKVGDIERQAALLGSLVLQLKKHHIPYGFYQNTSDWAHRKNEFHYIGEKQVAPEPKTNPFRLSSRGKNYREMLEIGNALVNPWEKLNEVARGICRKASSYPSDWGSFLSDYDNARKPNSDPIMRQAAMRLARIMKRLNLNSSTEVAKILSDKYREADRIEQKAREQKNLLAWAHSFVEALEFPRANWAEWTVRAFGNIKDMYDIYAEDAMEKLGKLRSLREPVVEKLNRLAKELNLMDSYDIVQFIKNKKQESVSSESEYLPCPDCGGSMFNYPRGQDGSQMRFRGSIECHGCGKQMSGIDWGKE